MKVSLIVSLFVLGVVANAYSPSLTQVNQLPAVYVKVNELYNADMSNYFTGYNISYNTSLSTATVQAPLELLTATQFGPSMLTDTPVFTFQSVPRASTGDINYSGYFLYLTLDSYLYWANISNATSVPQMVFGLQVTNSKLAHCYGADQINSDLLIVDCSSTDATGIQTDIFYYVSISQQAVLKNFTFAAIANTTYNPVTGTAARGVKTIDMGNGNHYILRFVGSNAFVNTSLSSNTYVEVYKAFDWTVPQFYKIIDRGFLGVSSLSIAAFKVLNVNLFILDSNGTVYYLPSNNTDFTKNTSVSIALSNIMPTGMSVGVEYYQSSPKITVLVYGGNSINEVDWTSPMNPSLTGSYSLAGDMTLFKADYSKNYVFAHVNSSSVGTLLINFARGSQGFSALDTSVPVTNLQSVIWWSTDRAFDNVYLWDANISEIHNFHYQKRWLLFNSTGVMDGSVVITATSYGSDGTSRPLNATFAYSSIAELNFSVFSNSTTNNLTLEYPSPFTISLDNVAQGPGINFTVNSGSPLTNYTLQNYDSLAVALPANFTPTAIYFHKIVVDTTAPGNFRWFIQADNFTLYSFSCADTLNPTTNKPSLNCNTQTGNATLNSTITHMVVLPTYSAAISSGNPDVVLFFDPTLKPVANFSTGSPAIYACADLVVVPSGDYIACPQDIAKRIVLWDAAHPDPDTQFVINRTSISMNQYPIFSPSTIAVSQSQPNTLFVKNDVGVLVINLALVKTLGLVEVSTNINLPTAYLSPPNFDFIVNGNSVLFFIYQATTTLLQEYNLAVDSINPVLLKQYSQFFNYTYQGGAGSHYSSSNTDRFFAVVTDAAATAEIVAFKAGSKANNNFLQSFNLTWPNTSKVLLSGSHSTILDAEYVLVGSGTAKLRAYVVYEHTTFSSNSYLKSSQSISEVTNFTLNASSTLQPASSVAVPFNVLTFNTDPPVTPGPSANDTNALNFINFTTNQTSFVFNPSNFFNGIITGWALSTENGNDTGKITLQLPIGSSNTAFTSPLDVVDLTPTTAITYAQAKDKLMRFNSNNLSTLLSITDMSSGFTAGALKCEGVLADDENPYSTSFCRDMSNSSTGYFITVSYLGSTPTTLPPVWTPLTSLACMRNMGRFVLMLENPNGQVANPGSKFHVYNFTNPAFPTYNGYLSGSFFNATSFQVGRWDIVQLVPNYYRIYFADGRFGVRTAEWNNITGIFSNPQSYNLLTDPAFIADNIPSTSMFLGISCLQFAGIASNDTYIALTTDTYNSYYVKLSFSASGALSATLQAVYKKVSAATNLAKITATGYNGFTYFAVSSYNPNTKEGFVTVYNGTSANQAVQIKSISYPPAAQGNIAFALFGGSSNARFWVYTPANTNLTATHATQSLNQSSVQEFTVTPYYSINVNPSANITSKYVNLTGSNDQNSFTVSFNITYSGPGPNPNPPTPPTPGSGSKWWIWLIVGLGILVIGAAIFAFVRYRQKKQQLAEDDVNAPLATNYA